MNSSQYTLLEPADSVSALSVSTIEELVERRKAVGLSIESLAHQLRLPLKQLQLIDDGKFDQMSSLAYARAVLRSYSKAVGVDASPLIKSIGNFGEAAELHDSSNLNQPVENRGLMGFGQGGGGSKWAWIGLSVAALAVAAFFLGPQDQIEQLRKLSSQPSKPASATAPATTEIIPVAPATPPLSPAPPATNAELKIDLQRSAWVEITQTIDGVESTQVISQAAGDGDAKQIKVNLPAQLVIGNADAVRILRDGVEVDLKPFIDGGLARLSIK